MFFDICSGAVTKNDSGVSFPTFPKGGCCLGLQDLEFLKPTRGLAAPENLPVISFSDFADCWDHAVHMFNDILLQLVP